MVKAICIDGFSIQSWQPLRMRVNITSRKCRRDKTSDLLWHRLKHSDHYYRPTNKWLRGKKQQTNHVVNYITVVKPTRSSFHSESTNSSHHTVGRSVKRANIITRTLSHNVVTYSPDVAYNGRAHACYDDLQRWKMDFFFFFTSRVDDLTSENESRSWSAFSARHAVRSEILRELVRGPCSRQRPLGEFATTARRLRRDARGKRKTEENRKDCKFRPAESNENASAATRTRVHRYLL